MYDVITGTHLFSLAGSDLAPDVSKDDEYVALADGTGAEGTGRSKQKAEQAAAREALCFLRKSETGCD